jgi:hypothetical protein
LILWKTSIFQLNISTAQEILALKQKFEAHEAKYLEDVRNLIREYIQKYDTDKTGMPDYALESSGESLFHCIIQRRSQEKNFGGAEV